jgi:hypothetical protein
MYLISLSLSAFIRHFAKVSGPWKDLKKNSITNFYELKKLFINFRVKMCTSINDEDFYTVHHEMGHIEYFMAYANQPSIFK